MATPLKLNRPVNHDGRTYDTIVIDEPSIGAIEAFEEARATGRSEMTAMIEMLAVDSEWPIEAVRKIRSSDVVRIGEALAPFVPQMEPRDGPNGGSSSQTSLAS